MTDVIGGIGFAAGSVRPPWERACWPASADNGNQRGGRLSIHPNDSLLQLSAR